MPQTLTSIEQFYSLSDLDGGKRELIQGEVVESPPARALHDTLADEIADLLKSYFASLRQPRTRVRIEAGFKIDDAVKSWLIPDVSVLHPNHPIGADGYFTGGPLIAIEVVSESNKAADLDRKAQTLLSNGTSEVWMVYPDSRSITIERSDGSLFARQRHELVTPLLPGFVLDLDDLFRRASLIG